MAFAELVKSLNKGAGSTLESSEGNLAGRLQATESPCLVAVLSQRQTGDSDRKADWHAAHAWAQAAALPWQVLDLCLKTLFRSMGSAQGMCSQV